MFRIEYPIFFAISGKPIQGGQRGSYHRLLIEKNALQSGRVTDTLTRNLRIWWDGTLRYLWMRD
jgi:hypothetical protein